MRRRLGVALVGMVIAALVLTGVGTIALASVTDRRADEAELREQTVAITSLLAEVTILAGGEGGETVRERLERITRTISVEGIGILVQPGNIPEPIGELPAGIELSDINLNAVQRGEAVSGVKNGLIWAAAGTLNAQGIPTLLVLTRDPDPIVAPAFRWFLLSSVVTVLLALLVTVRLSRRLTDPIREASATATAIAAGDLSARIDSQQADLGGELADLVHSVNAMADNLERSRALERQFLLSVSHDLRTPLTSIRGYAEALVDGAATDVGAAGAVIVAESRCLERLVGDLLLLARLEGTGFAFSSAVHDLRGIVSSTVDGFRPEAEERQISILLRSPEDATTALVDRDRFGQVVSNLIGNALRFAEETVYVTVWYADGLHHVAVGDDGRGIAEADLPHVFERLYVAQHSPEIKESGSGLGLAIVRELVEGMNGTAIARRSSLGGAEFVVSFNHVADDRGHAVDLNS